MYLNLFSAGKQGTSTDDHLSICG